MQKLIVKTLEQKGHTRSLDRRFNINSQNQVDVQIGLMDQAFRYPVNLLFLDNTPVASTVVSWKWILSSIFFTLFTLGLAYLYSLPAGQLPLPEMTVQLVKWIRPAMAGSILLTLISILVSIRKTQAYISLYTENSKVPLIRFLKDVPDKNAVYDFIKEIQVRSVQAKKNCKHNQEQILSAEMSGLRNLREHQVLSSSEYKRAKQNLMKAHETIDREAVNKSKKEKLSIVQHH